MFDCFKIVDYKVCMSGEESASSRVLTYILYALMQVCSAAEIRSGKRGEVAPSIHLHINIISTWQTVQDR